MAIVRELAIHKISIKMHCKMGKHDIRNGSVVTHTHNFGLMVDERAAGGQNSQVRGRGKGGVGVVAQR